MSADLLVAHPAYVQIYKLFYLICLYSFFEPKRGIGKVDVCKHLFDLCLLFCVRFSCNGLKIDNMTTIAA